MDCGERRVVGHVGRAQIHSAVAGDALDRARVDLRSQTFGRTYVHEDSALHQVQISGGDLRLHSCFNLSSGVGE